MMVTKKLQTLCAKSYFKKPFAKKFSKCVSLCKIIDAVAHSDLKGKQQLQSTNW